MAEAALWIAAGQRLGPALEHARINHRSFRRWRLEVADIRHRDSMNKDLPDHERYLLRFFDLLDASERKAEYQMVEGFYNAAKGAGLKGDWRALLALLERRFPEWQLRASKGDTVDPAEAEPALLDDPIAALADRLGGQAERQRTSDATVEGIAGATAGSAEGPRAGAG